MNICLLHRPKCHDCAKLLGKWGRRADIEYIDAHSGQERIIEILCYYDVGLDADEGMPIVVVAYNETDHDTARGYEECDKLLRSVLG